MALSARTIRPLRERDRVILRGMNRAGQTFLRTQALVSVPPAPAGTSGRAHSRRAGRCSLPGRRPLTYAHLQQHIDRTSRSLRAMGIGRQDCVAVVLPNGPEMVSAILSVASCAGLRTDNPVLRAEELDRYFSDLRLRALITQAGPRLACASCCSFFRDPCRRAVSRARCSGRSFHHRRGFGRRKSHEAASPGEVALLMLTSGTTSRPKAVPLTHANICSSAFSSGEALMLGETDRCLNVLPPFSRARPLCHGANVAGGWCRPRVRPRM